jgi:hypothetical protein
MEGEALAVVQKEERAAVLDSMMFRAHAEFVSDAIACAHKFRAVLVSQLVCIFDLGGSGSIVDCC